MSAPSIEMRTFDAQPSASSASSAKIVVIPSPNMLALLPDMYIHNPSRLERKNHGRWGESIGAEGACLAQRPACDARSRAARARHCRARRDRVRRAARSSMPARKASCPRPLPPAPRSSIARAAGSRPGLIDCHTHLVHAGNRANEFEMRLAGATYEEVARAGGGIVSSVKALRAASEDELVRQSLPRLDALIAEGVTTIEIKSGYGLDLDNEAKSLRAARRLGDERQVTVRTTFLGAHALPPEANGDKDAFIAQVAERDAAGHCRGKAGRCRRRLLRGHRLFARADRAGVRRGPRARPAGEAACRPALQSLRRSPRGTLRRAVGRPSRIYRRAERRGDGAVGHGRRAAARRLLFHPRGKEAAGRSVPRARREDGGRHRLQSRHLAADLAAAHHEHGGDPVRA